MRINESGRYIRQMGQPAANQKKAGQDGLSSGAAADADPTQPQNIVVISAENERRIETEPFANQQRAAKLEQDEMNRLLKSANARVDAESESAEVQRKCLIIAARIIAGDEVPKRDYRYLAKNNLELYCKAVCMRVVRKKARQHKAVSDDESTKNPDFPIESSETSLPDTGDILDFSTADNSSFEDE